MARTIARRKGLKKRVRLPVETWLAASLRREERNLAGRSLSAHYESRHPRAADARGESPPRLQRESARVRSRSAVREYSRPRAATSAVATPRRRIPARAGARQILRESARRVEQCPPTGRAAVEFRWGKRRGGSTNLRGTFLPEPR